MPPDEVAAVLQFIRNQRTNGDGLNPLSPWVSHFGTIVVFPNDSLSAEITRRGLVGQALNVVLQPRQNLVKKSFRFVASRHPDKPLVATLAAPAYSVPTLTVRRKKVALLVDGQNFLFSLRLADTGVRRLSPYSALLKIINLYQPAEIRFYICREGAIKLGWITEKQLADIAASPKNITIVDRPMKVIATANGFGERHKVDIDHLLIGRAIDLLYQAPQLEGLVLVSGDSDYEDTLKRWLGIAPYTNFPQRYVGIYAARRSMAHELRLLASSGAEVSYLENLVVS